MTQPARVLVVGNPNAGKSTLFNALTGGQAQIGNYPGTTVASTRGRMTLDGGGAVDLVDVPGTFSLASDRPDERLAIDAVLGVGAEAPPDALIAVVDGPRLQRSLYLVLQLLELRRPLLVVVNLLDEARGAGITLNLDALSDTLGVPVVGTVARSGEGLDELRAALGQVLSAPSAATPGGPVQWSDALQASVRAVAEALPAELAAVAARSDRDAVARWLLLSAADDGRVAGVDGDLSVLRRVRAEAAAAGRDLQGELVGTRYAWIDARTPLFVGEGLATGEGWTERLDRIALHPVLGTLVFSGMALLAFSALFSWADPMIGAIETLFGWLGDEVRAGFGEAGGPVAIARDLLVDGVIGGVGAVVVFLPQIALLFLFLAILEDCGYLSRASHLADRVLRAAGLPGSAFVPLISGYACAVPAIMATRTMPRFRDRLLTMMVLPLVSCSARLPVYALLIAALFPVAWLGLPVRPLALAGMYLFSTGVALVAAIVLGQTLLRAAPQATVFELTPYRVPNPRVVVRIVVSRCRDFLREAGGIILIATVVLWALLSFPKHDLGELVPPSEAASLPTEQVEVLAAQRALERSYGGRIGQAIEPAIAPLGYDWRIGVGLIGAFAAREVFVSTLGVVYGVADADKTSRSLRRRLQTATRPDGSPVYTPLVGLSIMVFFALSLQCLSTLAVLRKESRGWSWPLFTLGWMMALAWVAAFVVYQGGRALGFS